VSATTASGPLAIVALVGPTGVGKTAVAVELCEQLNGEIVGADSIQIYRGFDVGSGKPSAEELHGIAHHLLGTLEPTEPIDAARFAALADAAIESVRARGKLPVVVGGTGLWLRALLRGLVALPAVDPSRRASLEREFEHAGGAAMHARLRAVDPISAARVHPSDRLRIVRALEVHAQTGVALGELRAQHALGAPRYHALTLALDLPLAHWRTGIAARAARMFEAGLIDEVRGLLARYGADLRAFRSVGYRQVVDGLARGQQRAELEPAVIAATQLYGRRQRTWFRSDPSVDGRLAPSEALRPATLQRIAAHLAR